MRVSIAAIILGASSIWGMSPALAQSPLEVADTLYEQGALSDAIHAYEHDLAN